MITLRRASLLFVTGLVVVATLFPRRADAQSVARRVATVRDGKVRMAFAARPDVCGWGNSISRGRNTRLNWGSSDETPDVEYDTECSQTPVRVVLYMESGNVAKVKTYVGGRWRPATSGVVDIGTISVRDATDYLLGLAATAHGSASRDAILPATLADSVVTWPSLFRIARNEDRPRETRRQALFWIGQAAGDRIGRGRESLDKEDVDTELKKQAVFALSQRKNGEAVPALIQVARVNREPEVRKAALFWLGQTMDPRAISLFEEILRN